MNETELPNPDPQFKPPPVFNLPQIIVVLCAGLIGIHALRYWFISWQFDREIILAFSFIPVRYNALVGIDPWPLAKYWSPVSYSLLHADWTHLGINLLWLLAFGAVVARRIGTSRFLVLCIVGSVGGACAHMLAHPDGNIPVIGASAVVSACMGAAVRFAFPSGGPFGRDTSQMPAQSLVQAFSNPQVLTFTGIWLVLNLVFGTGIVNVAGEGQSIAWEAHVGGFAAGLLLFYWFDRQ